jgi:hypothetical protein
MKWKIVIWGSYREPLMRTVTSFSLQMDRPWCEMMLKSHRTYGTLFGFSKYKIEFVRTKFSIMQIRKSSGPCLSDENSVHKTSS